jgi:hypothetical protein
MIHHWTNRSWILSYGKDGKTKLNLDYDNNYLATEKEIPDLLNDYEVYSITYVGNKD